VIFKKKKEEELKAEKEFNFFFNIQKEKKYKFFFGSSLNHSPKV